MVWKRVLKLLLVGLLGIFASTQISNAQTEVKETPKNEEIQKLLDEAKRLEENKSYVCKKKSKSIYADLLTKTITKDISLDKAFLYEKIGDIDLQLKGLDGSDCEGQKSFKEALLIYRDDSKKNEVKIAYTLYKLGLIRYKADYPDLDEKHKEQIEGLLESVDIFKKIRNRTMEARVLRAIGDYYFYMDENKVGLKYEEQSLKIYRKLNNTRAISTLLNDMSWTIFFMDRENIDKALGYAKESLKISKMASDKYLEGRALANIGQLYMRSKNIERAKEYYEEALNIAIASTDRDLETKVYLHLTGIYSLLGNKEKELLYKKKFHEFDEEIPTCE